MKTMILSVVITLISACTLNFNAIAQNDLGINEEDMIDYSRPLVIADIATGAHTNRSALETVTSFSENKNKAKRDYRAAAILQKNFPGGANVSWYEMKHGIIASFEKDVVKTKVYFDSKGRMLYSIKYYDEKMMPQHVRRSVKRIYYDYAIVSVAEVNTNIAYAQATYVVLAQDAANIMRLVVSGEDIVSVKTYKRA